MHLVERAWNDFLEGPGGRLLTEALELCPDYLAQARLAALPDGVVLPSPVAAQLMERVNATSPPRSATDEMVRAYMLMALPVWAAYLADKVIYCIDRPLSARLSSLPWPEAAPTSALYLPGFCAMLDAHYQSTRIVFAAHWDLLLPPASGAQAALKIMQLRSLLWSPVGLLAMEGPSLGLAADGAALIVEQLCRFVGDPLSPEELQRVKNPLGAFALHLLLHMAAHPECIHPVQRPTSDTVECPDCDEVPPSLFRVMDVP